MPSKTDNYGILIPDSDQSFIVQVQETVREIDAAIKSAHNPSEIPSLKAWWAADLMTASDGAAVGTWPDQSGNGIDATQATSGNKPIYKVNIINGLPALLFDGVDDFLSCGHLLDSTLIGASGVKWTCFAVVKTSNELT